MKGRRQKISQDSCPQNGRAEPESYEGVQTFIWMTEMDSPYTGTYGLLDQILSPTNLKAAYRQVKANKGAGGIDRMQVGELSTYLNQHQDELVSSLLKGTYSPQAVLRVEIPKSDGGKRQLGIPTVVDRFVQQAISQVLTTIYEPLFHNHSYGFRPKRSAHDALRHVQRDADKGYRYVVDMDLEKFFDKVNHSKLMELLSRTITDGRVISLIGKYLRAGVMVADHFEPSELGVPQGGPLSPLLSNIMLTELDKELELRGHKFVRYADDCMILCRSKRAAARTMRNIIPYIEQDLKLKVNQTKTEVAHISKVKFLGYGFYFRDGRCHLRVHPKSQAKMKERVRELTCRSNGKGDAWRKDACNRFVCGWVNYFKLANMETILGRIDQWFRRRLRQVIWKQWKRVRTRFKNLVKLGISKTQSWMFANTRKGYWRTANSPIMATSITNERLERAGYVFFSSYYANVRPKCH